MLDLSNSTANLFINSGADGKKASSKLLLIDLHQSPGSVNLDGLRLCCLTTTARCTVGPSHFETPKATLKLSNMKKQHATTLASVVAERSTAVELCPGAISGLLVPFN
ncbi:Pre-protein VI [Trichinella pseudospiralis]